MKNIKLFYKKHLGQVLIKNRFINSSFSIFFVQGYRSVNRGVAKLAVSHIIRNFFAALWALHVICPSSLRRFLFSSAKVQIPATEDDVGNYPNNLCHSEAEPTIRVGCYKLKSRCFTLFSMTGGSE
jgi:hypothetical protein